MSEILFGILFFAGLFLVQPLSAGMGEKACLIAVVIYGVVFVLVAALLTR